MTDTFWVLIVLLFAIKVCLFGPLLWLIFRDDIRNYFRERKQRKSLPRCVYCQSVWATPISEGEPRWDGEELVITTTYECQHCHLPFWNVERVAVVAPTKAKS